MRTLLLAIGAAAALLAVPRAADPPGDIIAFYAVADSVTRHPPRSVDLVVACTQRVRADESQVGAAGWLSLLALPGERAGIVAFTTGRLERPDAALSTTVRYGPLPTARATASSTLDWAYVWDRNADGRADYAAYLQNAHPVLPDTVPADWPRPEIKAEGRVTVTLRLVELMIDRAEMVFRHYADDDFDGTVDAAVVERFSAAFPMFVEDRVIARRRPGRARADEAWAFRHAIADTLAVIPPDADGVLRLPAIVTIAGQPAGGRDAALGAEPADDRLAYGTRVLAATNALAARCGPARGGIRRP